MNKYLAEVFGTFALTTAVIFSLTGSSPLATPFMAALTLGLLVYSLGPISGAHFNPAVTLGVWSIKKIRSEEAVLYVMAQFVGAFIALLLSRYLIGSPASLTVANTLPVGLGEMLGALFFTFGIAAVVYGTVPSTLSGVVVGGSLLLGISIASYVSNGVLNPAVALGIGSLSAMYIVGPLVGGVIGMWLYKFINVKKT